MNILFVIPYVPNSIRSRSFNLIRFAAAAGHRVTVATLWSGESEKRDLEALRPVVDRVIAAPLPRWRKLVNAISALPTTRPVQARYCWQPMLLSQLRTLFQPGQPPPFDAIHVEHLRGVRYALELQRWCENLYGLRQPSIIWDSVDSISYLFRQASHRSTTVRGRLMTRLELPRTERYERWLAGQLPTILVTSPLDRQAFVDLAGKGPLGTIEVVPQGVDLGYFQPGPADLQQTETIVVTGKMSYHANITMVDFLVRGIMPLVWQAKPHARLEIVGKDPDRLIQSFGRDPRITVTGTVPEIRPFLQHATVAVAPLRYGAGIQNKVLEAMACGAPVVATSRAVSALTAVSPHHLLVADEPAEFAQAIIDILDDESLRHRLGQTGRAFVEAHHDWEKITGRLLAFYQTRRGQLISHR